MIIFIANILQLITAEIIADTRTKSNKGYPLKIRAYCSKVQKHRYIALKRYQLPKKLKIDNFVLERNILLQKEVEYCNKMGFDLETSVETIKTGVEDKVNVSLFKYTELTIKEREERGMSKTAYEDVLREFKNFSRDVPINAVDYNWVKSFITHKKKMGTGEGGVSYYIRTASAMFNEAVRQGAVDSNPFKGHKIKRTRTTVLELPNWDDIRKLQDYEPKTSTMSNRANMKRAADLFLFQIHIGGHYVSDVGNLNPKNNRIRFQRFKNRSKEGGGMLVDNNLSEYAKSFINKYGLDWIPSPENKYRFTNFRKNYNRTLGRISKHLDIEPKLETSMPRYLFRTAGGESRASEFAIYQLMGHKPPGISYGYQNRLPNDILDEEHQRILDYIFLSRSL